MQKLQQLDCFSFRTHILKQRVLTLPLQITFHLMATYGHTKKEGQCPKYCKHSLRQQHFFFQITQMSGKWWAASRNIKGACARSGNIFEAFCFFDTFKSALISGIWSSSCSFIGKVFQKWCACCLEGMTGPRTFSWLFASVGLGTR